MPEMNDKGAKANRPVPPHNLPLQILVCCLRPLTGLQVSLLVRSTVITLLDLTWVPKPQDLEHSDHLPYPDQISHKSLFLSSIGEQCSSIRMQEHFPCRCGDNLIQVAVLEMFGCVRLVCEVKYGFSLDKEKRL